MIRNFGVGLVALATIAAASLVWRRRRLVAAPGSPGTGLSPVGKLYSAGL